jgi:hypothetical protein
VEWSSTYVGLGNDDIPVLRHHLHGDMPFFMFQMFNRRSFMGGHRGDEIDDLKREIKGLKEEIVKRQSRREAINMSKDSKGPACPQTKD